MTSERPCLFLILDLLQDVNILWPVACLAAEETDYRIGLLVSGRFIKRDSNRIWEKEIEELARTTRASVHIIDSEFDAYQILQGKRGAIFAGSESNLGAHATSHNIFRTAPPSFLRVTLQHGFECVGFLQNREQSMVHGEDIRFGSDVVCSWMEAGRLSHLRPSEQSKLYVAGPSSLIKQRSAGIKARPAPRQTGLVCENLHSVRMSAAGDFKADYMETFFTFSAMMAKRKREVALRPHPGGQYVVRNAVKLPRNVILDNDPMYRIDLSQYAYGISAPSSVLIDMVLAGIPTAVWQDGAAVIDAGNYAGLTKISSAEEWLNFVDAAIADPAPFLERQRTFLEQSGMLADRQKVRDRFLSLLKGVCTGSHEGTRPDPRRILYVANADIPTLQLSFIRPLQPLVDEGTIVPLLITEGKIRQRMGLTSDPLAGQQWIADQIERFRPDLTVFCRYSGPLADWMIGHLREHGVPIIFHIDDDLLNVPREIGEAKFNEHNKPERLATVRSLLRDADLVYCSTDPLKRHIRDVNPTRIVRSGKMYCSGTTLRAAVNRPVRKIGYMGGGDHAHDFHMALPEIAQFLRERPEVEFEFFGAIPKPKEFDEFGDRIKMLPPVRPYEAFIQHFATLEWDIGICPLANISFNTMKANTKWLDYTSVGAAVIATAGMAYDNCCADDCGILVEGANGWREALHALCDDPERRHRMVVNAQKKLRRQYSAERLRDQVFTMFDLARDRVQQSQAVADAMPREDIGSDQRRVLYIANGNIPTLQLSFTKPLQPLVEQEALASLLITETEIRNEMGKKQDELAGRKWIVDQIKRFRPNFAVFCRYSGPLADWMIDLLRENGVPVVFHIDDDLLNVPPEIGEAKFKSHNRPDRLETVETLLSGADLVYCSTEPLKRRFEELGFSGNVNSGKIYCSGNVLMPATKRPVRKIGYMGFDHTHDFQIALPDIVKFLRERQDVQFELFGSIPKPAALEEFGERITVVPPIHPYEAFLAHFATLEWDIGICPLANTAFNVVKANTKWVEYSSVGAAVIATAGMAYDNCCSNDCGVLVKGATGWREALHALCEDPDRRYRMVMNAQEKIGREYSVEQLRDQVLTMLDLSRKRAKGFKMHLAA